MIFIIQDNVTGIITETRFCSKMNLIKKKKPHTHSLIAKYSGTCFALYMY